MIRKSRRITPMAAAALAALALILFGTPGAARAQVNPPRNTPRPTPAARGASRIPTRSAAPRAAQGASIQLGTITPPPQSPITGGRLDLVQPPQPEQLPIQQADLPKLTIIRQGAPIEEIVREINQSGAVVRVMEKAKGTSVDLVARDWTVEEILNNLVEGRDWTWIQRQDGSYEIWDRPSFIDIEMRKRVVRRAFRLQYLQAQDVLPAVQGLVSEVGEMAINGRTNELIVTDLPDKVALIESVIAELDIQLYTRTFTIRYARFADIEQHLARIKSPPGLLLLDPPNRRFIATDTFEKLVEMEQLIELLDIEQPMIAYSITNIGMNAANIQLLIDLITDGIATEGSVVEFIEDQGKLLVKDVKEVHDRIMQFLTVLDQPPKQVWLEGEILAVRHDFEFELGTQWTYSSDLERLIEQGIVTGPILGGGDGGVGEVLKFGQIDISSEGLRVFKLRGDLKTQLSALMSDNETRILLEPRVMVRNNEQVTIDVIQQNPQSTTIQSGFGGGINGFLSSQIQFIPTGLQLAITPTINNRGLIEMDIVFTNSQPTNVTLNEGTDRQVSAVAVDEQTISTIMIIPSGETRVIGGLDQRSSAERDSGLPFLARLPLVGWLFGTKAKSEARRKLMFYLTPTIVEERPTVALIPEPINESATRLLAESSGPARAMVQVNPIPEELLPYIQQAPPFEELGFDTPPVIPTLPPELMIPTPPPDVEPPPPPADEPPPPPAVTPTPSPTPVELFDEGDLRRREGISDEDDLPPPQDITDDPTGVFERPADFLRPGGAPVQAGAAAGATDLLGPGANILSNRGGAEGPTGTLAGREQPVVRGAPATQPAAAQQGGAQAAGEGDLERSPADRQANASGEAGEPPEPPEPPVPGARQVGGRPETTFRPPPRIPPRGPIRLP